MGCGGPVVSGGLSAALRLLWLPLDAHPPDPTDQRRRRHGRRPQPESVLRVSERQNPDQTTRPVVRTVSSVGGEDQSSEPVASPEQGGVDGGGGTQDSLGRQGV